MMVAATSISEWPASERIASEPERTPTMAFAIVSPAEATIEPSAAFSFSLMPTPSAIRLASEENGVNSSLAAKSHGTVASYGALWGDGQPRLRPMLGLGDDLARQCLDPSAGHGFRP